MTLVLYAIRLQSQFPGAPQQNVIVFGRGTLRYSNQKIGDGLGSCNGGLHCSSTIVDSGVAFPGHYSRSSKWFD